MSAPNEAWQRHEIAVMEATIASFAAVDAMRREETWKLEAENKALREGINLLSRLSGYEIRILLEGWSARDHADKLLEETG